VVEHAATCKNLEMLEGHGNPAAFSLGGRGVATGSENQTARLCDLGCILGSIVLQRHREVTTGAEFSCTVETVQLSSMIMMVLLYGRLRLASAL
jgi:hypothetical protein